MTIDERIEALTMNLELVSHQQETDRQRIQELIASGQDLRASTQELRASTQELRASIEAQRASIEAQRDNIEAQRDNIEEIIPLVKDLVRVAAMHEARISRLEGQQPEPGL